MSFKPFENLSSENEGPKKANLLLMIFFTVIADWLKEQVVLIRITEAGKLHFFRLLKRIWKILPGLSLPMSCL